MNAHIAVAVETHIPKALLRGQYTAPQPIQIIRLLVQDAAHGDRGIQPGAVGEESLGNACIFPGILGIQLHDGKGLTGIGPVVLHAQGGRRFLGPGGVRRIPAALFRGDQIDLGGQNQHLLSGVDGIHIDSAGAQVGFQFPQFLHRKRLQFGMDDLLGDILCLSQGAVGLLLIVIGLAVALLIFCVDFRTHAAVRFHAVFLGHHMVVDHVSQVKISGFVFQQQVDPQVSAHIHLPDMGEARQLVQALIRQAPPGLEGYKAAEAPTIYGNVVCGIGGHEGVGALVGHDGKQGGAEAHQSGQDNTPQKPGGIEPNHTPGNEIGDGELLLAAKQPGFAKQPRVPQDAHGHLIGGPAQGDAAGEKNGSGAEQKNGQHQPQIKFEDHVFRRPLFQAPYQQAG